MVGKPLFCWGTEHLLSPCKPRDHTGSLPRLRASLAVGTRTDKISVWLSGPELWNNSHNVGRIFMCTAGVCVVHVGDYCLNENQVASVQHPASAHPQGIT